MDMELGFVVLLAMAGILASWVLLPLFPAVLIYRLFPSTQVAVSGPLAGLTVKASGAFAAYLVVFAAVMPWVDEAYNAAGALMRPMWTITGQLRFIDKKGNEWTPGTDVFRKISIRLQPESNSFESHSFSIAVPEGQHGLPTIYLDTGVGLPVPLKVQGMKQAKIDKFRKVVDLSEPIEVKELPKQDSEVRQAQTVRP